MAHTRIIIFLLTLCILTNTPVRSIEMSFGDITEILHFAREAVTGALETLEWTRKGNPEDNEFDFPFIKKMERRLMNQISLVSRKIENYEENIESRTDEIISTIIRDLPLRNRLDTSLHEMSGYIGRVDDIYHNFIDYANTSKKYEKFTMEDFAQGCVSSSSGALPDLLNGLHRLVVPISNLENSILVLLAMNAKEAASQICDEQQSPQQLLYNLYNTITLTEIKGYAMVQFSYTLLRLYNNGTFNGEMNKSENDYVVRTAATLRAVKTAMDFAPRELWRCDPSVHEEDSTYTELKQLFQGYIINEVDLNPTSTCKENCGYYSLATVNGCYENQFCAQQRRCNGKVLNCQYVDSDMWICPSAKKDNRRYEYIEYENGRVFGNKGTCRRGTTKVDSWWRWLFWHCSYCMCLCDDHNSSSDRYFSLRESTSDVENNWVIIGLQLVKLNKIVHMQIQEGELMPRGGINVSSVRWKKVDNFTISDSDVENGRDYHTLAWEKRALDLDDLTGPEFHVLTGVKWRVVGAHLNFEIRVTPFNFTTGKLIKPTEKSTWISNDNTDVKDPTSLENARTELKLEKPDIPTRLRAPALPDSQLNQYLNFAPTDLEKDAAQSTIPYLDIQPVVTNPPFPLCGAGIFHKGRGGSGGFVAPKLITYDFTKHLHANLPPPPPIIGVNEIPVV